MINKTKINLKLLLLFLLIIVNFNLFCDNSNPKSKNIISSQANYRLKTSTGIIWKYTAGDPAEGSPFVELDYDLKAKISLMLDS